MSEKMCNEIENLIYINALKFLYSEPSINYINKKDICFCGNNKELFNCCFKKNLTLGENLNRISKDTLSTKFSTNCLISLNNKNCKNKTIKAHSISKKKNLSNKNLYTCHYQNNEIIMSKVKESVASVFKGVCGEHDKKFNKYADLNSFCSNFAFQQYYRGICYELFTIKIEEYIKEKTSKYHGFLLKKFNDVGDYSKFYLFQRAFEFINKNHESLISPDRLKYEKEKRIFEKELKNDFTSKNDDFMYFKCKKLNNDIKFLGSCVYSPNINANLNFEMFNNIQVSKDYYENQDCNLLNINVLSKDKYYYLYMSCRKDNVFMVQYIDAFFELDYLEGILNRYSFLFKNSYYFGELIESLSCDEKKLLCKYYIQTSNPFLKNDGKSIFDYFLIAKPLYFTKNDFSDLEIILK